VWHCGISIINLRRRTHAPRQTGPVSCGFMFFEAKNIKASAATRLERVHLFFLSL
jgi:hypothetical protein